MQGSDVEARDINDQTPLLLASSKRAWQAVDMLIQQGANIYQRDSKNRNLLHLIIKGGGKPSDFSICFMRPVSPSLNHKVLTIVL